MKGIFKECDIRGIYDEDLFPEDAYQIGRAIGTLITGKKVVVGGDARTSTPILKENMIRGLRQSGAYIYDIGLVPTPVLYFAKDYCQAEGLVMVTASHNPAKYNGFKVMLGAQPVTAQEMDAISALVQSREYTAGDGGEAEIDITNDYIRHVKKLVAPGNKKVVIDACNGAESVLAPKLFREMGYQVEELYCTFDGTFPNRDPNPAVYPHLKALQNRVLDTKADFGVAFDGDGDRVVLVDETGTVLNSETTLCILMQGCPTIQNSSVVYDLKSSSIVRKTADSLGSKPIMERSGHAYIKATFYQHDSCLAGEISGHFFFQELRHDDGLYAALKIGDILSRGQETLSERRLRIPQTAITPDIRIHWPYDEQKAMLAKVEKLGAGNVSYLDGVRIEFDDGWLLVRQSVTEELVTIRIEGDDEQALARIIRCLLEMLPELQGKHPMLAA